MLYFINCIILRIAMTLVLSVSLSQKANGFVKIMGFMNLEITCRIYKIAKVNTF